ncbi:MAG: phosphoribosylglycinamide formyltransferase [Gammaproteobacteria bacterium]|nr:phosphoribosylglycinamide formyltransferase [Gammaproteobacteria bacterium]MDH5803320.1 phosphoribosylglycinamide formyltransferase [Gammaproteobacteria bacterium]
MLSSLTTVVLISGDGSNLQTLIDQLHSTDAPVTIKAVISNKAQAHGLVRAEKANIPTHTVSHAQFPERRDFDRELIRTIDAYQPQLVILAGFMRILTAEFVQHYRDRLINIHPSLLPQFRGLNTHARALQAAVREHGASVHFVTEDLDSGPVAVQAAVPVLDGDTEQSLSQRVLQQEHIIYPLAVLWIAEGRLKIHNEQLFFDNKELNHPIRIKPE